MEYIMPKLSIICPCFNHEKFIDEFLQSFINQTEKDIELIIINDCSTDNTVNIIKSYNDNRITLIENEYNMGINRTIKKGIYAANAPIFGICASDDILFPYYAETVINIFNYNPNIHSFFTTVEKVDINGKLLNDRFESPFHLTKYEVLEKLFLHNFIPAPGSAFKRDSVINSIVIPPGLFQFQDYHFHIQMLLKFDTFFHKEPLVYYRISNNSVSINNDKKSVLRSNIEHSYILDLYYNINNVNVLKNIFKNNSVFEKLGEPIPETIPFFVCLIALESYNHQNALWGYHSLIKYISNDNNQQLIYDLYGIQFKDIINEAKFLLSESKKDKKIKSLRKKRNIALFISAVSITINIILIILFYLF